MGPTQLLHARRVSLAPATEMEIMADDDSRDSQFFDKKRAHERLSRECGEPLVEASNEHGVEVLSLEKNKLDWFRREAEERLVWLEEGARVWLEGEGRSRATDAPAAIAGRRDQRLVTPVHTIEIADRYDGSAERCRNRLAVAAHGEGHRIGAAAQRGRDPVEIRRDGQALDRAVPPHLGAARLSTGDSRRALEHRAPSQMRSQAKRTCRGVGTSSTTPTMVVITSPMRTDARN